MIIEFLFAMALDMSLPEFQPQEDVSGNVIVSVVDDISGEFVVQEVPINDIPIEAPSDLPLLGLSQEEDLMQEVILGNVLRNGNVITIESSVLSNMRIRDGALQAHSGDNLNYIFLSAGIEYTLYNLSSIQTSLSLSRGASVTQIDFSPTFTPSVDCYILRNNTSFYVTYNSSGDVSGDEPGGDVSGDTPGGDTPGSDSSGNEPGDNVIADLTSIENKLNNIITLQRSILMTLLVTFLFPIIKSCVNLLKGGKDV